jgi:hypothetical protein
VSTTPGYSTISDAPSKKYPVYLNDEDVDRNYAPLANYRGYIASRITHFHRAVPDMVHQMDAGR